MKNLHLLFLFLLISRISFSQQMEYSTGSPAQNLVPNYSYEQYFQCPDNENEISFSTGWKSYYASPDYFNSCATNLNLSVPYNWYGSYQPSQNGVAYAGFFAYWSPALGGTGPNMREHIGRQLSSSLIIDTKYYVSFKVSLAANIPGGSANCAVNNIGIKFSTVPYDIYADSSGSSPLVNNFAHVYDTTLITDTVNWTTIKGSFIADSAYTYLIIGNFFKDVNTDSLIILPYPTPPQLCRAYYYVDDVCVSTDSLTCELITNINETQLQNAVKIYPNPFSKSTTVEFYDNANYTDYKVTLYNVLGEKIKNYGVQGSRLIIEKGDLSEGIYFLKIQNDSKIFIHKLIIHN